MAGKYCRKCPLRTECCSKVIEFKKLEESVHKPLYDKMQIVHVKQSVSSQIS